MQRRTIKVVLTLLIVSSLFLVLVPGAISQGTHTQDFKTRSGKALDVDQIYLVIQVTGTKDGTMTYNILSHAIKTKDDKAVVMNFTKPLPATYYYSNDTAIIPLGPGHNKTGNKSWNRTGNRTGRMHDRQAMTDYNNASVNVAGASAVIVMKNITMLKHDNTSMAQFAAFSVYLPDGTVKSYKLTTPVKIVASRDTRTTKVTANPEFRADLQDALKGGAKFPSNAAAVPLKKIDAKK